MSTGVQPSAAPTTSTMPQVTSGPKAWAMLVYCRLCDGLGGGGVGSVLVGRSRPTHQQHSRHSHDEERLLPVHLPLGVQRHEGPRRQLRTGPWRGPREGQPQERRGRRAILRPLLLWPP